jgi:hypothetical protein
MSLSSVAQYATTLTKYGKNFWSESCQPGELQNKVVSCTRTIIGLTSIYFYYPASAAGALLGSVSPNVTHGVSQKVDAMITGFWNSLSYKQKMAASTVGITLAYAGFDYIKIPGSLFAAKLAAELAYKNSQKQEIAAQTRMIEKKYEME